MISAFVRRRVPGYVMDRSLKLADGRLLGIVRCFASGRCCPAFVHRKAPAARGSPALFSKKINLGLDLQGGKHIVYNIDLDKAVDDKASEIKRDLESDSPTLKPARSRRRRTRSARSTVLLPRTSKKKRAKSKTEIKADYKGDISDARLLAGRWGQGALCYVRLVEVRRQPQEAALDQRGARPSASASTRSGVAEPSVVEKGDDIIVELPGDPASDADPETEALIAQSAKLEMKVVDDCTHPSPQGCTAKDTPHDGSPFMKAIYKHVGSVGKDSKPSDPLAGRSRHQGRSRPVAPRRGRCHPHRLLPHRAQPRRVRAARVGEEARQDHRRDTTSTATRSA